ncbi:MAG: TolC family protein [Calditrichaeota bacterium]|nr:MAG: TolC family protein [Calditrichota bacterium]
MDMKSYLFLGVFLLCATGNGLSQQVLELTLDKAIHIAMENNQQIQMAKDDQSLAKQQVRETSASLYPQIDGTINYTRNIKSPVFFSNIMPEPIRIGNKNAFLFGMNLKQAIWLGGKLFTARQIAELSAQGAEKKLALTRENVVLDVTKTFYSALLMQEMLRVTRETLDNAKANYKNILKLRQQGLASDFDSLRAKVRVASLEPELIKARSNVETVTNALKFLLNLDLQQKVKLVGELRYLPEQFPENEREFALEHRKELSALRIQREIQRKVVSIERAAYFPSVFAVGNLQTQASSEDFHITERERATIFSLGLMISVPIFHGFKTLARMQQAKINLDKINRQMEMLAKQILLEVQNSRLRLQEAEQRVKAQTESVQQAEKALEIARVRFQNGLSTQLELNDAETALARAKFARLSAIYDYLTAKADYEKAVGIIQ